MAGTGMVNTKPPEVGAEIEALCTKCKDATVHVITIIKKDEIARVMCKSCQSTHRYRQVDDKIRKKIARLKKVKKTRKETESREHKRWNKLLEQADPAKAVAYKMASTYAENDVIQHDTFGLGVVVKVLDVNKVSVVFSDGVKNMVQNYKSAR